MDDIDGIVEREQQILDRRIRSVKPMEPGVPGDCDLCGEWSGRLVEGVCAPCRDRYKL
jgi:hypothetical protein